MSSILELNLSDLVRHYHDRTEAHVAADLLDRARPGYLSNLLRDYRKRPIAERREVELRDAVDDLLTFYGLLEVGIVAGWLPWPLPEELSDRVRIHLTQPDILRYYREFYPLDLPAMLAARLSGWRGPRGRLTRGTEGLFQSLLDISTDIEKNTAVDMFLWFLDDGYCDGYSFTDCYKALRTVERYIGHLTKPPAKRNALDLAVVGIGDYLTFCRSLDALLVSAGEFTDLQRAMWCHHAYWLRSVEHDVEEVLERMHALIRPWTKGSTKAQERGRHLRPDARLMRLVRGAYRFRSVALKVPVSAGEPLESLARKEQPTFA